MHRLVPRSGGLNQNARHELRRAVERREQQWGALRRPRVVFGEPRGHHVGCFLVQRDRGRAVFVVDPSARSGRRVRRRDISPWTVWIWGECVFHEPSLPAPGDSEFCTRVQNCCLVRVLVPRAMVFDMGHVRAGLEIRASQELRERFALAARARGMSQ